MNDRAMWVSVCLVRSDVSEVLWPTPAEVTKHIDGVRWVVTDTDSTASVADFVQ